MYRRLIPYLRPYWGGVILAPLLMLLEVSMDLMQPRLLQYLIDDGLAQNAPEVVRLAGGAMLLAALIGLAGGLGCGVYAVRVGQCFGADLRAALFARVQSLSCASLDRLEAGSVITRLTNDVGQLQEAVMLLLRAMIRAPLLLVGSLLMAALESPELSLILVALLPVVVGTLWALSRLTLPLFEQAQARLDGLNGLTQENLAGLRLVRAFARGTHELARFARCNGELLAANLAAARGSAAMLPCMMLALNAGVVAALWLGGSQVIGGRLRVGELIAFINYLLQGLIALMMFSMMAVRLTRAAASARRVGEILDTAPEPDDPPEALRELPGRGRLEFERVDFAYAAGGDEPALAGIDLALEPGRTLAVLGPTGAGKTTLLRLLLRLYEIGGGRIKLDGTDVRGLARTALRRALALAPQEAILFTGTIRDNLRYGRPEASEAEIVAAARLAQAHEFILALPGGYDAPVGQRGVNLSGGQKQRLALARALLVDAPVLLLDDCTSAVDSRTEGRILAGLAKERGARTRLIVAQRLGAARLADSILMLDQGRVIAHGPHAELLTNCPLYRELYDLQTNHGVLDHGEG